MLGKEHKKPALDRKRRLASTKPRLKINKFGNDKLGKVGSGIHQKLRKLSKYP